MTDGPHRKTIQRSVGYALAGSAFALLVASVGVRLHVNFATTGFLHLLTVLVVAMMAGFWEATLTSAVALVCLNYFFVPPVYTLYVADPQNWVALLTFECTALLVSKLSIQKEREAYAAILERSRMVKLYELSRRTLLTDLHQRPGPQIVADICEVIEVDTVALLDATTSHVDMAGPDGSELARLAWATYTSDRDEDHANELTWQRVLRPGQTSIGAVVLRGGNVNALLVDSTASLIAVALERMQSLDKQNRAELARQTEQLRTTVLDALAHAFKTPLTAIRAASSGLLECSDLSPTQGQLVALIDEESSKLSALSTRLLRTAKLESSATKLRREPVVIPELIEEILAEHADQLDGHPTRFSFSSPFCTTDGDRELLGTAIAQVVDNAAKYSAPGSPIAIRVDDGAGEILISIHNEGSEVSPEEHDRIFERFYRGSGSDHVSSGTGLGLSITKQAAEAHQGRVWVSSERGKGTTFFLSLPCHSGDADETHEYNAE